MMTCDLHRPDTIKIDHNPAYTTLDFITIGNRVSIFLKDDDLRKLADIIERHFNQEA